MAFCVCASAGRASDEAAAAEERLLGTSDEAWLHARLPFTRHLHAGGPVLGSLADSTAITGVPAPAMIEPLAALATAIDLERDLRNGDRFFVRWQQEFTIDNRPIGTGRVLSVELRTAAKGTVAITRFQPKGGTEQFYLANGRAAVPPPIRLPLDSIKITSGFGLRPDPLDQPQHAPPVMAAQPKAEPTPDPPRLEEDKREIAQAYAGFGGSQLGNASDSAVGGRNAELDRIMAERRVRARERARAVQHLREEEEKRAAEEAARPPAPAAPPKAVPLFMHEGLDLLGNIGAPIHAAADGVVFGARPNRGYGNWIRIDHPGGLATVYGHLSGFAPDIGPGTLVQRGDLIGFVGTTGRAQGAHLHFEVLAHGRPVDPASATTPAQLRGPDLERFRKQLLAEAKERD